jgi:hypothetical protein
MAMTLQEATPEESSSYVQQKEIKVQEASRRSVSGRSSEADSCMVNVILYICMSTCVIRPRKLSSKRFEKMGEGSECRQWGSRKDLQCAVSLFANKRVLRNKHFGLY